MLRVKHQLILLYLQPGARAMVSFHAARGIKPSRWCGIPQGVAEHQRRRKKKSFANMVTVVRLHLMSYVSLLEFIQDTYKAWRKNDTAPMAFAT